MAVDMAVFSLDLYFASRTGVPLVDVELSTIEDLRAVAVPQADIGEIDHLILHLESILGAS